MKNLLIESIKHIENHIDISSTKEDPKLIINSKDYISNSLNNNNFVKLSRKEPTRLFSFIDGGCQNIYNNSQISVDYIKTYHNTYKNSKKVEKQEYNIILITKAIFENNKIIFKSEIVSKEDIKLGEEFLKFNPKEETLRNGAFDAKVTDIANKVRRYLELTIANKLCQKSNKNDVVVIDGSLKSNIINENILIKSLKENSIKNNVFILGICKSSTVYTNTKESYEDQLINMTDLKMFNYKNAIENKCENHDAKIHFLKLNQNSNIILLTESLNGLDYDINIFNELAFYANDAVILGYPYGLIDADLNARVSNKITEYLQTILLSKTKLETKNLHQRLDKIKF